METGSGSMTDSGGSSTNSSIESLNGLKFGQKIYFENTSAAAGVGATTVAAPPDPAAGSSSSSGPGKKPRVGVVQSGQPPRCQVEGCKVDLSDAKAYYSRHKVCGLHSKAPKAIVAGLEQRFCQQCSRFHQLPEFDQGKRSCRRRLAGHNERRRKPPSGSLLSSRYGRFSPSIIESGNGGGSFIMDFTAYLGHSRRDVWPTSRSSEHVSANNLHPWQNNTENPPHNLFLQGTSTGVLDSDRALSLLSNQPWGSRNQLSTLGVGNMINTEVSSSVPQPAMPHGAVMNHYSNASWGDNSGCLAPFLEPIDGQFSGGLPLSHQSRRQYMELEQSDADDASMQQHIHRTMP